LPPAGKWVVARTCTETKNRGNVQLGTATNFLLCRMGFDPRAVHVGYAVEEPHVWDFSLSNFLVTMLLPCISFPIPYSRYHPTIWRRTFWRMTALWNKQQITKHGNIISH
jgi:hypothetical protein